MALKVALKNFYEPVNLLFSCHSLPYSTMYMHTLSYFYVMINIFQAWVH